jgi:hypothetical protein
MRRSPIRMLWPSAIELWYVAFTAFALLMIGNGKLMLEKAGLIGSAHLIGAQVSTKLLWGNNLLDTFHFTANAVSLVFWGATGLIIYSSLQAMMTSLREFQYKRDFDSNRYIHPQWFTHQGYWKQVVSDAVLGFVLLALFAAGAFAYVVVVVPDSFAYFHRFILHPSLSTVLYLPLSFVVAFVAAVVLYILLKLVIRHHRTSALSAEDLLN